MSNGPDLLTYVLGSLESQSPDRLKTVTEYATDLAAWRRANRDFERQTHRLSQTL